MASRVLITLSEIRVPFIRKETANAITSRASLAREKVLHLSVDRHPEQKNTQSFSTLRARDLPIFQRPSFYHRHSVFLSTLRKRNYAPLVTSHVQKTLLFNTSIF